MKSCVANFALILMPFGTIAAKLTGSYSGIIAGERTGNGRSGRVHLRLNTRIQQSGDHLDIATWTEGDVALITRNLPEWCDFAVYGFFVSILAKLLFRLTVPRTSLIALYGAFAVGA
ncbi:MAG: hypothetical protein GDA36_08195 [Rhodobacteraceae bacterium]|nr:hypothetical protein [Paracoccaceae bacterium]